MKIKYQQSSRGNKDIYGETPWLLAGMSIARIKDDDCKYEYQWNHFSNYGNWKTNSYQCLYQWDENTTKAIEADLLTEAKKNPYNSNGKYYLISMKKACKILARQENFNNVSIEKKDNPANWIKPKEDNK